MIQLHTYFRSSAAYRVRIGLHIKGLPFESIPVHLLQDGGQQHQPAFRALNPAGLVPVLTDGHTQIAQSLAILEYLEELHPHPPLLPQNPADRAWVRSLALDIACDIHPLNNLRVLQHLSKALGADEAAKKAWITHWISTGFEAFERRLVGSAGSFCVADQPTLADIALIPQVFNAERFAVDLSPYPTIQRVNAHCLTLEAFSKAAPGRQPDAQ